MADHSLNYRGRYVEMMVDHGGRERWSWSYSIDGAALVRGPVHRFPAPERPLSDAVAHAKEAIDKMT